MVPFAATANPRRNALASPSAVVAPPPDVHPDADQARRLALPQAAAVAPAPELGGPSARAGKVLNPSDARVVPPPPSVQGAGNARTARSGSMAGAGSQVYASAFGSGCKRRWRYAVEFGGRIGTEHCASSAVGAGCRQCHGSCTAGFHGWCGFAGRTTASVRSGRSASCW